MLTQCGLATVGDVDRALAYARREKVRLGEALIRLGLASQDKITWALGVQFQLSYVDLEDSMMDWELLLKLPLEELREHLLLPLAAVEGRIHAVIADPTSPGLIGVIEKLFPKREVIVQLASPEEITEMLDKAELMRAESESFAQKLIPASEATTFAGWIKRLGAGLIHRIAVLPDPRDPHSYLARYAPDMPDEPHGFSESEMRGLVAIAEGCFLKSYSLPGGFGGILSADRATSSRPVRGVFLAGAQGCAVALEALAEFSDDRYTPLRPVLFAGDVPQTVKAELLQVAAEFAGRADEPTLSFESRLDGFVRAVFQFEIPDSSSRRAVAAAFASAERSSHVIFEIESPFELPLLAAEKKRNDRWMIVSRLPMTESDWVVVGRVADPVIISSRASSAERRRLIQDTLENAGGFPT